MPSIKEIIKDDRRVIAVYPALRRVVHRTNDLIFLSQILYWASSKNPFYKTNIELSFETGLTKREIEYVKKGLSDYSFLSVSYRGVPRKTYYKVDWKKLQAELMLSEELSGVAMPGEDGCLVWTKGSFTPTGRKSNLHKTSVASNSRPLENKDSTSVASKSRSLDHSPSTPEDSNSRPLENNGSNSGNINYDDGNPVASKSRSLDASNQVHTVASNSRPQEDSNSSTLYKDYTKNTTKNTTNIIVVNDEKFENSEETTSSFEDKPQSEEEISNSKFEYPVPFELLWSRYKPRHTKQKGNKRNALKAYEKASQLFTDEALIEVLDRYMDSTMFELGPAHLSTFLNGIITDTKYRDEFVEGGYETRLERVKNKHHKIQGGKTDQERYRQDIAKQGELNANDLIDRSSHISVLLSVNHGLKMGAIEHGDRKEWLPYLGPDYVAIPIKHPMSKTDKIKVLFHIDELRNNLYVHLHGHVWNDKLEEQYQESNKEVEWIDMIPLPSKEEYSK